MTNSKNPTPSNCFSTIIHHFICSNNLPTLPSPPHPLLQNPHHHHHRRHQNQHHDHDHHNSAIVAPNSQAQITQEPRTNPGIVARLMGLDSFPNPHYQNYDSLYRSKSLNSIRFLPDFDPARIPLHRRARASASFRERETGHDFFIKIDENSEFNNRKTKKCEVGSGDLKRLGKQRREKVAMLKWDDGIRRSRESSEGRRREKSKGGKYERGKMNQFRNGKNENNVELLIQRQSNALSRSPVSVLDHHHHHHEFDPPSNGDSRRVISNPRRKLSRKKFKIFDVKPPRDDVKLKYEKKNQGSRWTNGSWEDSESMKQEYFGEVLGQSCKLVEEQIRDPKKWIRKYQMFKVGFMQDLGTKFGHEILDFLLDELMHELIVS